MKETAARGLRRKDGGTAAAGAPSPSQRGHLLVGLMVLVAVILIMLTVTGQSWTFLARRDNEAEMIFRGEQYANAIEFYKKETGQYPLELKVLMQRGPHRHRFIRKLYKDPLMKDGKWGLLFLSPTGKGFINPYASRRDQQQFVAGSFGDSGPGGLGGGFRSEDDASDEGSSGGSGSRGRFGRRSGGSSSRGRGGFGRSTDEADEPSGYSEPIPEGMDLQGGDVQGLPIVGVVHKKKESGLKIYKNQANLNDWAFTLMAEGQDLRMGGAVLAPKGMPRQTGVGDLSTPIYLNPSDRPGAPPPGGSRSRNVMQENLDKLRQKALEEERKRKKEEEEQRRREQGDDNQPADDDQQDPDQDPNDDLPPEEQPDPNAPNDPNAATDPNAPNAPGVHAGVAAGSHALMSCILEAPAAAMV